MSDFMVSLGCTPYQIANLETLCTFLEEGDIPPPKFSLSSYIKAFATYDIADGEEVERIKAERKKMLSTLGIPEDKEWYEIVRSTELAVPEVYNHCGTSACAVGHGPLAGIPVLPEDRNQWPRYEKRVFGVSQNDSETKYKVWTLFFGPDWLSDNNTAKGTAMRIRYIMEHGLNWIGFLESHHPYVRGRIESPWFVGTDMTGKPRVDDEAESD